MQLGNLITYSLIAGLAVMTPAGEGAAGGDPDQDKRADELVGRPFDVDYGSFLAQYDVSFKSLGKVYNTYIASGERKNLKVPQPQLKVGYGALLSPLSSFLLISKFVRSLQPIQT